MVEGMTDTAPREERRTCGQRPAARCGVAFISLVVALSTALTLLGGCNGREEAVQETASEPAKTTKVAAKGGDAEAGRVIYEKYCHFCHGRKGLGDGPVGIAISPHPADFVNDTKRMSKTDAELFKSISEGIEKAIGGEEMSMPSWKDILTEQERWDVLAYIRYLSRRGRSGEEKHMEGQ